MEDMAGRVAEWARKCGYTGPMPDDMSSFLNESTLPIWNYIMKTVKPRDEVDTIRRQLIVHRLRSGMPLSQAMKKEYDTYNKLKTVTKLKEDTLSSITAKQVQLNKLKKRNNKKEFELEKNKASNKEIEMKTFLLEEKAKTYGPLLSKMLSKSNILQSNVFLNKKPNREEQIQIYDVLNNKVAVSPKNKQLVEILHSHRNAVFSEIGVIANNLFRDLSVALTSFSATIASGSADTFKYKDKKFQLYAKCLENDLDAKIYDKAIKKLQASTETHKDMCMTKLVSLKYSSLDIETIMKKLENQANLAGLEIQNTNFKTRIDHLTHEIKRLRPHSIQLEDTKKLLQEISNSMNCAVKNVSIKTRKIDEIYELIQTIKLKLKTDLEKLFDMRLDYMEPMKDNVLSKELEVFRDYPLEYFKYQDKKKTPQSVVNVPLFEQPCAEVLTQLPHSHSQQTPWELITSIHSDIHYLSDLVNATGVDMGALVSSSQSITVDFIDDEEVVGKLVNDLKDAEQSACVPTTRLFGKSFEIFSADWLKLNAGSALSEDRTYEGKSYAEYEKEFMLYYNIL